MPNPYRTNGAAAVDQYAVRYEQNTAAQLPQGLPEERRAPQPKRAPRAKPALAPFALVGALVAVFLLVMVVQAHVRLYEYRDQQGSMTRQQTQLDQEIGRLNAEYNSKIDLQRIDQQARALGMRQPSASQKVYLNISGADNAEVLFAEEKGFFENLWDSIRDGVRSVVEYFR